MAATEPVDARLETAARLALSLNDAGLTPEDILVAWLIGLPDGVDLALAARRLVEQLDRAAPLTVSGVRLRALLIDVAISTPMPGTRRRNASRWRH